MPSKLTPKQILSEFDKLNNIVSFSETNLTSFLKEVEYLPIQKFLENISIGAKPETATHNLFETICDDLLKTKIFHEFSVKGGFVDYAIQETNGNPLLFELKPNFYLQEKKIKQDILEPSHHREQIQKYLATNEYIILSDLNKCYIYNREALVKFKPFIEVPFTRLMFKFIETGNLWDTLKELEDQIIKYNLDKSFFEDLKKWFAALEKIEINPTENLSKEELIILLINKLIFIKTLEDHNLIPYKFLEKKYLEKRDIWYVKGAEKVFRYFFDELEDWMEAVYDTELFTIKFWDYIVKTKTNLTNFQEVFEHMLGIGKWNQTFSHGLIHYNYRLIDEDVFGKAYETFIAENKKDSGIFYTPKPLTDYMCTKLVNSTIKPVIDEIILALDKNNFSIAEELIAKLNQIKFIDTTSGSGSFLIKVLKIIYSEYSRIKEKTNWVNSFSQTTLHDVPPFFNEYKSFRKKLSFDDEKKLIAQIILKHIHGSDIDERAIETAKSNIWKEAIKLNRGIFNFRKLNGSANHILPNLTINFITGDVLNDLLIDEQFDVLKKYQNQIKQLQKIRKEYIEDTYNPELLEKVIKIKKEIREKINDEFKSYSNYLFITLHFFDTFFDEEGNPKSIDDRGFNGIIGNPPWEAVKPIKKEFAHKNKYELDILLFDKWFEEKLKSDETFKENWKSYKDFYKDYSHYLSSRYKYQDSGDQNYYKLFLERDLELLKKGGWMNLLIPSGIQTDRGCKDLRKLLLEKYTWHELTSFENRGYTDNIEGKEQTIKLFPDVDNRFKFTIIRIENTSPLDFNTIECKFYLQDPKELKTVDSINYDVKTLERFSPENLSFMEFENKTDFELCSKIRDKHDLLYETDFRLRTEFHMTNDSHLFKNKRSANALELYEGKMIHQFQSAYSDARYFVNENDARKELMSTEIYRIKKATGDKNDNDNLTKRFNKKEFLLDYETYRLVYRAIGSSTNERTLIATILPPKVFIGHSMNYLSNTNYKIKNGAVEQKLLSEVDKLFYLALLNSLTLNYYIRNKVSANLTMNFIYELPFPKVSKKQKEQIASMALSVLIGSVLNPSSLLSNKDLLEQYKELMNVIGVNLKDIEKQNSIILRSEIEYIIAHEFFKLDKTEWDYLVSTFTFGAGSSSKTELDSIISCTTKMFK